MEDAPHIIVCLPTSEQPFGEQIVRGLAARGLRVSLISDVAQLQQILRFAAMCIGITSRAHDTSLVSAALTRATEAQRPIFPLLLHDERDLPLSLSETQWCDFTRGFGIGWLELLLALDMEGLSRWPYDPLTFDGEVVLGRAQNGLTLFGWQVYRCRSRLERPITRGTITATAIGVVISLLAWVRDPSNWILYLVAGFFYSLLIFLGYRGKFWHITKHGPIIVLTPRDS